MATTLASGGDCSITVVPAAHAGAAGGEVRLSEEQQTEVRRRKKKLKWLNKIVFYVALLEWGGNAVGTLASLWGTVVLLGGFCSMLNPKDFWYSTVMIFLEATRVFIRNVNDEFVNQWLFGSTRAFRWGELSFRPMLMKPRRANLVALVMGIFASSIPFRAFRLKKFSGLIKVALLVITSQMLSRLRARLAVFLLMLLGIPVHIGSLCIARWSANRHGVKGLKASSTLMTFGVALAWAVGMSIMVFIVYRITICCAHLRKPKALITIKVITALALACSPFFQRVLDSSYYYKVSIPVSCMLLFLSTPVEPLPFLVEKHFFLIVDTIMPILFFWSVIFPLPGINPELSFSMLFSVIAAVLIDNLQIPVAFLQVLLSFLRLRSLLGHRHHDYHPLPNGASPNMVPSIVVFFMLELFQGSSYMIASLLGLFSLLFHRLLARASGLNEQWGAKAVNLYFRQAYQARKEKGLFRSEKEKYTPRLESFAIESLRFTSSNEMQIVGLLILDNCLQQGDSKSSKKLITEIVKDGKNIISKIIGNTSYLTDEENSGDTRQEENTLQRKVVRCFSYFTGGETSADKKKKIKTEQKEVIRLSLKLVKRLAINGGKLSARFRQELSENPFFLDSLEQILNLEDCQLELWEPAMDVIAMLALDEAARQEIGSTKSIIPKLMHAFLMPRENNDCSVREENDYDRSLRKAAGEALANLTIMSTDNCWDILLADTEHNLVMNLIKMLEDEYYICVAANLLHNLCANSRDKLMDNDFGANVHLKSALPKVMQIIMTKEGKELEAALSAASQIGYVIPEDFAQNLESYTDAAAEELVEKLVNTLKSKESSPEYPRIRRVLVEMVISIVEQCPGYIKIFVEKKVKDALDKVKGTPSRLEKYSVFLGGDGVVAESLPMRDLVDKAKRLIDPAIIQLRVLNQFTVHA